MYTQDAAIAVFDHDWTSLATDIAIPHGLYDLKLNTGYLHLGTSHDTGEFACDAIRDWWNQQGRHHYPTATSILLLCDGGGSNGSRQYLRLLPRRKQRGSSLKRGLVVHLDAVADTHSLAP
ncbi:hypothetical protein NDA01_28400 [Trichocoleus desertorum AS-A10]